MAVNVSILSSALNVIVIVTLAVRKLSIQSSHGACLKTKELSWIWRCQYWLSALSAEQCSVYWSNKYMRIVQASLTCRLCCLQSQVGLKAVQEIAFNLLLSFSPNVERSAFQLPSSDPYVSVPHLRKHLVSLGAHQLSDNRSWPSDDSVYSRRKKPAVSTWSSMLAKKSDK